MLRPQVLGFPGFRDFQSSGYGYGWHEMAERPFEILYLRRMNCRFFCYSLI